MVPECNDRPRLRPFCLYLLTTILLTTIIFVALRSHTRVADKVEELDTDVKRIFKEVVLLTREIFQTDSSKQARDKPVSGSQPSSALDSVEIIVKKHLDALKMEWVQTKQNVEATLCQFEKRMSSAQIDGETTRTDYALESLGGQIAHVEDTPYVKSNFLFMLIGLAPVQNEPRNVIRPSMSPGDCYAFRGTKSIITVKLMAKVFVDSVTVQHIPENLSPSGHIKSAPKDFSVYGLRTRYDSKPFCFGFYAYEAAVRKPVQVFMFTQLANESFRFVQFRFSTNHGHANFTCVYRLSVHGKMDTNKTDAACGR